VGKVGPELELKVEGGLPVAVVGDVDILVEPPAHLPAPDDAQLAGPDRAQGRVGEKMGRRVRFGGSGGKIHRGFAVEPEGVGRKKPGILVVEAEVGPGRNIPPLIADKKSGVLVDDQFHGNRPLRLNLP